MLNWSGGGGTGVRAQSAQFKHVNIMIESNPISVRLSGMFLFILKTKDKNRE